MDLPTYLWLIGQSVKRYLNKSCNRQGTFQEVAKQPGCVATRGGCESIIFSHFFSPDDYLFQPESLWSFIMCQAVEV